ncbi:hypothetical protein NS183_01845 [Microbacterium testaceum]|uniref:DUF732 domain-containing protein n=1 Tax=Microbacterium testaceum TaxID=2033 RepID=UPI000733EF57|nr:DUF732 domain-containing protein [Microbacterium testaceum]KTS91875.1 hypothetical protein NS183_01845 [Microbacterium testaceum]
MKRLPAVLVLATAAVLLAGCTSETTEENITVTPGQTGTFSSGDTTVVVEPEDTAAPASSENAAYLTEVRSKLGDLASATDDQLVSLGESTCEQLEAGTPADQVILVVPAGLSAQPGDGVIVAQAAQATLCD